jgi:sulfite exporter TauE/SafE
MVEFMFILASAFLAGLIRGTSACTALCAPAIVPYIASKQSNWREGVRIGILINLPRIVLLSTIGAVIGFVSFSILQSHEFRNLALNMFAAGYTLIGLLFVLLGSYMFAQAAHERRHFNSTIDARDCSLCNPNPGSKHCGKRVFPSGRDIVFKLTRARHSETQLMLIWGSFMALACIVEIVIVEAPLLVSASALLSAPPSAHANALLGAVVMLVFSIAASVPILVVTTTTGKLAEFVNTPATLNKIKTIGAAAMFVVGLCIMTKMLPHLIL